MPRLSRSAGSVHLAREVERQLPGGARAPSGDDDVCRADGSDEEHERQHAQDRVVGAHHVLLALSSTPPAKKEAAATRTTTAPRPCPRHLPHRARAEVSHGAEESGTLAAR